MRAPFESRLLLAAASRLVPRPLRSDWLREWEAEIWWWWNGQPRARTVGTRMRLLAHCRGAFADARCLRSESQRDAGPASAWLRSPGACLVAPALLLAVVILASGGLQRTRAAFRGAPFPGGVRAAVLSQTGPFMGWRSGVPSARVDYWNARSQKLDGAAILVPYRSAVAAGGGSARGVLAARVGPEFFNVLGVRPATGRIFTPQDLGRCRDCALVAYDLWLRSAGRPILLNGQPLRVIGALPRGFRFPGVEAEVWTLADPPSSVLATAVCKLKPGVTPQAAQDELRGLIARAGSAIGGTSGAWVTVTPLDAVIAGPIRTLIPAWLGVLMALAIVAFAGRRRGLRYRAFWAAKAALALTVLLFAGIEFGGYFFGAGPGDALLGEGALWLWLSLAAPVFALWWSWADQRTRCRVCLARLSMPAPMGYGARMLFETSGTELLCPKGHGRLLVSDGAAPHSEWAALDNTWRDLFGGAPPVKTGGGTNT